MTLLLCSFGPKPRTTETRRKKHRSGINSISYFLEATFLVKAKEGPSLKYRFGEIKWGSGTMAMIYQWWWETRKVRTVLFQPDFPGRPTRVIFDRSWEDRYNDPGDFVLKPNKYGRDVLLTGKGYAVFDNPKMPIVGEGEKEPNDTYVQQLVASAKAAIDKLVEMGIADRKRVAIGGHSYGAFMAANLLAHSRLFATGIARSGAYNRTLTPFGFQAEERTFWEAPDTYFKMSPFMHKKSTGQKNQSYCYYFNHVIHSFFLSGKKKCQTKKGVFIIVFFDKGFFNCDQHLYMISKKD